jgi:hypothetical protein
MSQDPTDAGSRKALLSSGEFPIATGLQSLRKAQPYRMNLPVLDFSTVEESDGFQSLREPWNALWASLGHPHFFSSFDWCWNAWRLVAERHGYKCGLYAAGWTGAWC